ncbi:transcriptional antiterminator [Hylemonella gracilis str. Niagara R]|uniref:Transcriptional antiterminator n=1 Tax=Hylemonella gracilis str. Niagara R TaxID=1458275 RepID=A0A016XD93_9BURK|nr:TnsA endonuclease N-terminal domain-containing protein [Hylemonella gracilis]EYC50034.1 transcriptional antiterminator [Hylemonella gracilis str. Niagara R]
MYLDTSPVGSHAQSSTAPDAQARKKEPRELKWQRQKIKQGRGTGSGPDYLPFLQIERTGFQSHGRSHLIFNQKIGRQHHLLSDLELLNFLLAWSLKPNDIREQFPLQAFDFDPQFSLLTPSARGSIQIARDLGIRHPQITRDCPRVMTTDLLVSFADGSHLAIHAKYSKELSNSSDRAIDLRAIERQYWLDRKAQFIVVNENRFTRRLADLMMWALDGMNWAEDPNCLEEILAVIDQTPAHQSLGERLTYCSARLGMGKEIVVRAFKHAILTRRWRPLHLDQEMDLSRPWPGRKSNVQSAITARIAYGPRR